MILNQNKSITVDLNVGISYKILINFDILLFARLQLQFHGSWIMAYILFHLLLEALHAVTEIYFNH